MAQSTADCDYIFKIIVIGDSGVGKSSLTVRLSEDVFFQDYASTIAIDFRMYFMHFMDKKIRLQIWDTAGQERFQAVATAFYRGANGVLLCFDLTHRQSFEHLSAWLDRVKMQALPGIPVVLVGCKADEGKARKVSTEEAQAWAKKHGMGYVETSAKSKDNVVNAFQQITIRVLDDMKERGKQAAGAGSGSVGTIGLSAPPSRPGQGGPGARRGGGSDHNDSPCGSC